MREYPKWLEEYKVGDKIDFNKILDSRVVFYPGSLYDGQPIRTYNKKHFSSVFLYADYGVEKENTISEMTREISNGTCLNGYHLLEIREISERDICPKGWTPHYIPSKDELEFMKNFARTPFGLFAIYERNDNLGEEHGSKRIALIYLCADGIATYDALFANRGKSPYILVVQEHGFGGNYNAFGKGSALEHIAQVTNTMPSYILFSDNYNIWDRYELTNEEVEIGGMWMNHRRLYKLEN